ncbi:MAG: MFS transporter [Pseudomonadota bacterium]
MNPAWRATAFSAALFLLVGANLPYLPVWLEQARGFSGTEISAIAAAGMLLRVFAGPLAAARAETTGLARALLQMSMVLVLAYAIVIPQSPKAIIATAIVLASIAWGTLMPLVETLLLTTTKDTRPDYGTARSISSAAFILTSLALGVLIGRMGEEVIIYWMAGVSVLMAALGLTLPKAAPAEQAPLSLVQSMRQGFGLYRNPRILLAGLASSFIQAAHAYYYNLGSNVWLGQGIAEEHIGALWSIGVALEVVLLLVSGWLFRSWSAGAIMLLGGMGALIRWTITGFAPSLEVLYAAQALHALSFAATHIGYMQFLRTEIVPEKIGTVISISSAVGYGPMLAIFGLLTGYWYDTFDTAQAQGFWLMAASAFVGCLCLLPLFGEGSPLSSRPRPSGRRAGTQ